MDELENIDSEKLIEPITEVVQSPKKKAKYYFLAFILILFVVYIAAHSLQQLNMPSADFPLHKEIIIEEGMDVSAVVEKLHSEKVIKSRALLYYILVILHEPTEVKASTYVFTEKLSTMQVAQRLVVGDFDSNLIRFTHFEGERVSLLASRAAKVLPSFDSVRFLENAIPLEGKLLPDTYFIPTTFNEEDLLRLLSDTFSDFIQTRQEQIDTHSLTLDEILVLASILEREANSTTSLHMVSGILQNRLEIDMPLQADASIEYVLEKPLSELLPSDLEIDTPYNTYLYKGLPPTPIGNPGKEAIVAVLEPTQSTYLFYITGNDGEFYYAETYNQHLVNIRKYLR